MFLSQNTVVAEQNHRPEPGGAVFLDTGFGFMPAFKNLHNDEVHLCAYDNGELSVMHILDNLPPYWVDQWGVDGRPESLKQGVIAGFMRYGRFYTLRQINGELLDA